ncbi:MAG: hypothetical protein COT15_00530 [Candidatus Diapherotrites archaeon CG08_land_8_20_14_0_20_34_12]|nr:MAG: hypothetical protein COT15_00530 [Candidatus Diapherotrites archaeon CG08_land_8_20_14_0_20_34_12]
MTFSSAAVFWNYSLLSEPLLIIGEIITLLLFLFTYSFLLCLLVLLVERELGYSRFEFTFYNLMDHFVKRVFWFFILYTLLLAVIGYTVVLFSVDISIATLLIFLISLAVLFVPQALIIEKRGYSQALEDSIKFTAQNPQLTLLVLVVGSFIVAILLFLEYLIDILTPGIFAGRVFSFLILSFFLVPFIEILKTYAYMLKFNLIQGPERIE